MIKKLCLKLQTEYSIKSITPVFVQAELDKNVMHRRETHEKHFPYETEAKMLKLVKSGNVDGFTAFINELSINGASVGRTGEDEISHGRNLLVASVTMFTRAAIEGGMDNELAYDLSDAYLTCANKITLPEKLYSLVFVSGLDFTVRVRKSKISRSLPIKKCCEYVSEHLHEKITLKQLSDCCRRNQSYISTCFKSQLNATPIQYIHNEKLNEACKLLLFSNFSVSDIAAQLSYCSHSNFCVHFKSKYGVTPLEYRNGTKQL